MAHPTGGEWRACHRPGWCGARPFRRQCANCGLWAQADNEDQIPANKLHNAGGGMGTDTDQVARASAMEALLAAQAATTLPPRPTPPR